MSEFHNHLSKVLRYNRAPIEAIRAITAQSHSDGAYDKNNNADAVLADFLADHGDPREQIVRQDLSHRCGENPESYCEGIANHREELIGDPHPRQDYQPCSIIGLADGTQLHHHPVYNHDDEDRVAHFVSWVLPPKTGRLEDEVRFDTYVSPEDHAKLLAWAEEHRQKEHPLP